MSVSDVFALPSNEVAFVTGPRLGKHLPQTKHSVVKKALMKMVTRLEEKGFKYLVGGLALGVDHWAFDIALDKTGLIPIGVQPFDTQHELWNSDEQKKYFELIERVEAKGKVICLSRKQDWKVKPEEEKGYVRSLMFRRNFWMVRRASPDGMGIAVWNGKPSGTGNCVKFAVGNKIKMCVYNPETNKFEVI